MSMNVQMYQSSLHNFRPLSPTPKKLNCFYVIVKFLFLIRFKDKKAKIIGHQDDKKQVFNCVSLTQYNINYNHHNFGNCTLCQRKRLCCRYVIKITFFSTNIYWLNYWQILISKVLAVLRLILY